MPKNSNLIPVKKLITRGGSPFVTTVWVSPEEYKAIKSPSHKSTEEMYKVGGKYTPERKKEHKRIVTNVVNSCPKPPKGKAPIAILLLGGAASGKSTVVNKFIKPNAGTDFGTINADDIKESIPEYKSMMGHDVETAAARVHEESSEIGKAATRAVIDQKRNFIYDAVLGNPEKAKKLIADLKSKGYRISLVGVNVDAEAAVDRAESRAFGDGKGKGGSGRFVPSKILLGGHKGSSSTFEAIKGLVDNVELYDNNVPFGDTPIKVVDGDKVLDQKRYDSFKSKSNIDVDEILKRRSKQNIQKSLDAMGISKGVETPINSNKTNLSVSSEDYYGSDIYKGLYQDDLEKDLRKAELGEKPAQEETKDPTIEEAHADEMKRKDLDRDYQSKQDKKFSYSSLSKDEQRALKVLVNIDGKSAKEKIDGVMEQYHVSKIGAINILADATKHREEEVEKGDKKESKETNKKEDTVEKSEDQIPGGKGDNAKASKFDPKELDMGVKTEMEHTDDKARALEITLDHLTEDPKYYSKLKASGLADELKKGGEGSRGGKIIGHSKNGTPIYAGAKTGLQHVDDAITSHGAHSETPAISRGQLHKVRESLSKKVEHLASKTSVSGQQARDLKQHGDALGHVQAHIAAHDKKLQDNKKGSLQKALDSIFGSDLLEKAIDPNGKWVTIDGRHVHLNSRGDVDAGKIYGKDNKDSKDQTTNAGGKDQGKGPENKGVSIGTNFTDYDGTKYKVTGSKTLRSGEVMYSVEESNGKSSPNLYSKEDIEELSAKTSDIDADKKERDSRIEAKEKQEKEAQDKVDAKRRLFESKAKPFSSGPMDLGKKVKDLQKVVSVNKKLMPLSDRIEGLVKEYEGKDIHIRNIKGKPHIAEDGDSVYTPLVNKTGEAYFRSLVGDKAKTWEDDKKKELQKAFDTTLEKAIDPNGRWVTIDGRHVHLNSGGKVDAGKIYGKDNKDSKDNTTNAGGKDQGKGSKETHSHGKKVTVSGPDGTSVPSMDTFKKLASESKDVNDFMAKVREIKDVPASVSKEFSDKYGKDGDVSVISAAKRFMEEHGKNPDAPKVKDSWYAKDLSKRIDDLKSGLEKVKKYPDDFKETSGGSGRTKKEIISDFNDHIKMNQDKLDKERESNAKQESALSKFKRLYDDKSKAYIEGEIAHTERSARAFARDGDTAKEKDRKDHVKDLRDILDKRVDEDKAKKERAAEESKNSSQIDLFEDYDKQTKELAAIADKYAQKYEDGEMDYKDTAKYLKEVEALGYTFDYGLDNQPTNLRKKSGGRTKPSDERRGLNAGATRII